MLPLATAVTCAAPGFMPGFAPFFLLIPLFWLIVIVLVVTLVGRRFRRGAGGPSWGVASRAEAVLAERYARGEIDEAEYHARLDVLRAG